MVPDKPCPRALSSLPLSHRKHRLGSGVCIGLAVAVLCLSSAAADQGVAIDLGKVDVSQKLSRGGDYRLPDLGVRNPGTETTTYRMGVSHIDNQPGRKAPAAWFSFDPPQLTLDPGEARPVSVTLDIPAGARPDDYEALLKAEIAPQSEGTTVGAAAAARLKFTIKPSNILQAWQLEAETWLTNNQPWTILVPLAAVLTAFAWWVRRRFTFSVGRRT